MQTKKEYPGSLKKWIQSLYRYHLEWAYFLFRKKEKLAPRFVRSFQIDKRVGSIAYKLILPQ